MDTVSDVMFDRIKEILELFSQLLPDKQIEALQTTVVDIADEAFSVCGISDKEQNEEWD